MEGKIGIVGYALVGFGADVKLRSDEMVFRAAKSALDSAGITRDDLGTTVISSIDAYDGITISNGLMAPAGGGYQKDATRIQGGGVSAILSAFASILSNRAAFAVVAGADAVRYDDDVVSNSSYDPFFRRPVGMFNLPGYAMFATSLLREQGATERDFALAAAKSYEAAAKNPYAHRKTVATVEDVLESPYVFWPLRELELAPISKGAAALVLASEEKTRELSNDPIWVSGIGAGSNQYYGSWSDLTALKGLRAAGKQAYRMAGITDPQSQIDAAEVFAPFAPFECPVIEALGLCKEGESLQMLRDGTTSAEGAKPVNPSGGTVGTNPPSCGGFFRTIQAAMYLKEHTDAGPVVVQDSDINLGFFGETYHVAVLERGGIES
jgi:acetyl-CoA acetyltransferase